jgi:osmotically-inducible protein OsmY
MQVTPKAMLLVAGLMVLAAPLGGCGSAMVGAGATAGLAAAQERSLGDAIDDTAIHAQVVHNLLQRSETLFTRVGAEVVEGRVLLTGIVPTPEDRVEAVRLTWQVEGVREVLNEIEVGNRSSLKDMARDTWITTQLRTKMLRDAEVFDINYSLETINGVVYVMGIARTQKELDRVTDHARNISGVKKVVSHVVLKDDPRRKPS